MGSVSGFGRLISSITAVAARALRPLDDRLDLGLEQTRQLLARRVAAVDGDVAIDDERRQRVLPEGGHQASDLRVGDERVRVRGEVVAGDLSAPGGGPRARVS